MAECVRIQYYIKQKKRSKMHSIHSSHSHSAHSFKEMSAARQKNNNNKPKENGSLFLVHTITFLTFVCFAWFNDFDLSIVAFRCSVDFTFHTEVPLTGTLVGNCNVIRNLIDSAWKKEDGEGEQGIPSTNRHAFRRSSCKHQGSHRLKSDLFLATQNSIRKRRGEAVTKF